MGWKQQTVVALLLPLLFIVAVMQWRWISGNKSSLFRVGGSWYVERLSCELCGEMGFVRSEKDPRILQMCPVCQGRGGAYLRRLNDQDVICPACGGMGRIWDDPENAHFCERCGGRGLVHVEDVATNLPPAGAP
ncbi:MAG: hypothetical protein KJ726_11540 [Verrucomicrobia bacterium]|nr:hypothetical protein [Verrucomicrobiota bacterium]MBU1910671.1 hypothetical protein [Verrucomicrobiota bacterium]